MERVFRFVCSYCGEVLAEHPEEYLRNHPEGASTGRAQAVSEHNERSPECAEHGAAYEEVE